MIEQAIIWLPTLVTISQSKHTHWSAAYEQNQLDRFDQLEHLSGPTGTTTSAIMPKKANIFDSFSHSAIQQFKEAFGIMDADKDGLLSSSDLVAAFGAHGKNIGGGEAQVRCKTIVSNS